MLASGELVKVDVVAGSEGEPRATAIKLDDAALLLEENLAWPPGDGPCVAISPTGQVVAWRMGRNGLRIFLLADQRPLTTEYLFPITALLLNGDAAGVVVRDPEGQPA